MFGQLIVSGLAVGACYALLALAMVIIYKSSEVLNFAQGEMAMVSTFVAFTLLDAYHIPFPWAAALTFIFAILLGIFFEIVFLRQAKDPTVIGLIIITLGFEMVLMGFAGWKWGPDQRSFSFPVSNIEAYNFYGLIISKINFWTILITLVLMFILFLFFRYTKIRNCNESDPTESIGCSSHGHPHQMDSLVHLGHQFYGWGSGWNAHRRTWRARSSHDDGSSFKRICFWSFGRNDQLTRYRCRGRPVRNH